MRFLSCALAAAISISSLTGCSFLASALPAVSEIVSDGSLILSTIEAFISGFFRNHPDPVTQAKYDAAMQKTRLALIAAERALAGVKDITEQDMAGAFAEFRAAYEELLQIISPMGVKSGDRLAAAPGQLMVPSPAAFRIGR